MSLTMDSRFLAFIEPESGHEALQAGQCYILCDGELLDQAQALAVLRH